MCLIAYQVNFFLATFLSEFVCPRIPAYFELVSLRVDKCPTKCQNGISGHSWSLSEQFLVAKNDLILDKSQGFKVQIKSFPVVGDSLSSLTFLEQE